MKHGADIRAFGGLPVYHREMRPKPVAQAGNEVIESFRGTERRTSADSSLVFKEGILAADEHPP
jgi:hypothetical protein